MSLTRKEFLSSVVTAVAGATGAAVLIGCSDNGGSADAGSAKNCSTNGAAPAIGGNHGHTMMVSAADVLGLVEKTYTFMGTATPPHTHTVTVTAGNFTTLKNNADAIVTVVSSTEMGATLHSHTVMISCA